MEEEKLKQQEASKFSKQLSKDKQIREKNRLINIEKESEKNSKKYIKSLLELKQFGVEYSNEYNIKLSKLENASNFVKANLSDIELKKKKLNNLK